MIQVIADPGSCHQGKKDYGFQLIQAARDAGADVVKFQLFGPDMAKNGNVELSFDLFREFYYYGKDKRIKVTASVFNQKALEEIFKYEVPFIKFGYSQQFEKDRIRACLNTGRKAIVSSDVLNVGKLPEGVTKLYCISEYPVRYVVDFDGLFDKFDGFSDHTMGWKQTVIARNNGAKIIEKHIRLPYSDITCPDAAFALHPREFTQMVKELNS